jgi:cell pole-organizing protein PopZ
MSKQQPMTLSNPVDEGTMEEMRASIRRAISAMACEPLQESTGTAAEPFSDGEHEPGGGTTDEASDIMIELPIAQSAEDTEAEVRAEATAAAIAETREELARSPASAVPTQASNARPPAPVDELGPALAEERTRSKPPLLSPKTDAVVTGALNQLATTRLRSGSARTIEDLVEDMLRPMLVSWLDVYLPPLVEKLVREEIERLSRKSR